MGRKRLRPILYKYNHVGKWLYAFYKYKKDRKDYTSVNQFAQDLGHEGRSGIYWIFSDAKNINLYNIDLLRDVCHLSDNEVSLLILMVHRQKTKTDIEELLFKKMIITMRERFKRRLIK